MKLSTLLVAGAVAGLAAMTAASAQASIVSVGQFFDSQAGLTVQTPAPGTAITADFIENNGLPDGIVFAEQQNVALAAALPLDTGGVLAAGTRVSSYFVGFDDPVGGFQHTLVNFSSKVLGIEYVDGGNLGASDVLGLPSLSYNTGCGNCGYEGGETATFTGNLAVFASNFSQPGDYARVLTAAAPEPAAWAELILGFGLFGATMRRRRGRVAA